MKSQIGHTKGTAGIAGLLKLVLALHQRVLPPTAKVTTPSTRLDFEGHPVYLNSLARPWVKADGSPRRAGVSAFGFGGTNYHIALEEYGTGAPTALPAREELFRYKGLIVGSFEASFFTADQRQMIHDFVSQRGGGIVCVCQAG